MVSLRDIDGFLYKIEYESIQNLIRRKYHNENKPLNILEIGSWKGKSTLMFLQARTNVRVTSIDPFCGPPEVPELAGISTENQYNRTIRDYPGQTTLIKKYSNDLTVCDDLLNQTFDIVFIDGEHTYKAATNDIKLALVHTRSNGFIIVHDYWINADKNFKFRGVADAVHEQLMYKYKFLYLFRSAIVFQNNEDFNIYEK